MIGRLSLLGFTAATGSVHLLAQMPDQGIWMLGGAALCVVTLFVWALMSVHRWHVLLPLGAVALGLSLTILRVEQRLADVLHPDNENKVSRVVLRIASLPRLTPDSRQFEAEVISSIPDGVPSRIMVTWAGSGWGGPYGKAKNAVDVFPELIPGQVWRMALTLKPPHGLRNPGGFDYEAYAFAQGIRATGTLRGTPRFLRDEPWASLSVSAQRARHHVRQAMLSYTQDKRYGAVMLALVVGDQAGVSAGDWQVFNRTGLSHLVSISGSHISMVAALGGGLVFWLWRRWRFRGRFLAEYVPAQVAAALVALLIAWLYCLLAGWGVPARRTFLMLTVIAVAYVARLPLNSSRLLALVAFAVVLLDPWALLSAGFWLSFAAVYVLMSSASWYGRKPSPPLPSRWAWLSTSVLVAARLQLAITVGLMPLLALLFHEVSLVSPLANAYAIPLISLIVTPLSLLLGALALMPGLEPLASGVAWLSHGVLEAMMAPTLWLSQLSVATVAISSAPGWATFVGMAGLVWALMPYGLPGRHSAWLLMVPALLWPAKRPLPGEWDLHVLDVGQAGAVVVQTARHSLLFDTGIRNSPDSDSGARVIAPFLRFKGIRSLDVMVVSHADIDHVGGVRSVLQAVPVQQSYASFDLPAYLAREARLLGVPDDLPLMPLAVSRCEYGQYWRIDDVDFEFLWPLSEDGTGSRNKNDGGCVLRIRGKHHTALLPGDISATSETALIDRGLEPVDVVLAGHHGSKTSSSAGFVEATGAPHVIAQAGAWSRYGHPHRTVQRRWEESGAQFWRSDRHGSVHVSSASHGLLVHAERQTNRRYWQTF